MNEGTDPVEAAESCLAGGESMALLRIYQFKDDVEAHDDDLRNTFQKASWRRFIRRRVRWGTGSHTNIDVDNDVESIPLCGVFRAASWNAAGTDLYLAAAHEDRETPYLLLVGVAQSCRVTCLLSIALMLASLTPRSRRTATRASAARVR